MKKQSNLISQTADRQLREAAVARKALKPGIVEFLGEQGVRDPGRHYRNYAEMINSRVIALYDDSAFLLKNGRISSACVIARCILETFAIGDYSQYEIVKHFNKDGLEKAGQTVIAYINSSRFKVEEQKRFAKGKFSASGYHFTPQALARMEDQTAKAKHILNALRHLYGREMEATGAKESRNELIYDYLSEWTHPSQTSLFHRFARKTWLTESSIGPVSIWDTARAHCSHAMHFIVGLPELIQNMHYVSQQLSEAFQQSER